MHYDKVCIEGLAYELPPQVLTTRAMESALGGLYGRLGIQPGWLEAVTGIKQRRMWATGDNAELAAARAAERAVAEGDVSKNEIDVLVSTSVYKAHLEPSVACKVHHALGLRPTALNFDVGNACLGFLSGMQVVANMIELGQARAGLVVAGECSREVTRSTLNALQDPSADMVTYKDNLATMTLGSGAAAMLLVHKDLSTTGHRLVGGHVQSATQHAGLCYGGLDGMKTDPTRLLAEGVSLARRTYDVFRNGGGLEGRTPAAYALHQVGKANHDSVCRALELDASRALRIYPDIGNVGAASVAIAAKMSVEQGRCSPGDTMALMGIGSGLNVAMLRVDW